MKSPCGRIRSQWESGESVNTEYTVSEKGVSVRVTGEAELSYCLPAFFWDGETKTEILREEKELSVFYHGWCCRYTVSGTVFGGEETAANRNGYYKIYGARAQKELLITIRIEKSERA